MLFDTHLTEEFDALRDTVKRMCDTELAPRAAAIDAKNEFPADMWKKLGEIGVLGMTIPEEYGGTGLGYTAHILAMEEISRASGSVGLAYGASTRSTLIPSLLILVIALGLYVFRVVVQDKKPLQLRLPAATMPEEEKTLDAPTTTI